MQQASSFVLLVPRVVLCVMICAALLPGGDAKATEPSKPKSVPLAKDEIAFKNGDRVTGRILGADADSVSFRGNVTGDLTLAWADIDHLTVASGFTLHLTTKATDLAAGSTIATVANDSLKLAATGAPFVIKRADLEATATPSVKKGTVAVLSGWGGSLQSQDNLIHSTQKQVQLGATLHVTHLTESQAKFARQMSTINLQANYSDSAKPSASPVITSLYSGGLQHNVYLTDKGSTYLYGLAGAYHNSSLGLDVAQEYGSGVGWKGRHNRQLYGLLGDLRYIHEDLKSGTPAFGSPALGASENYEFRFPWPKKGPPATFSERILFTLPLSETHALLNRGFAQVNIPVNTRLSFGLQFIDDYLRNAPKTSKQNYANTQFTFKYAFGGAVTQ
jgi:hypothetical protein